MGEIEFKKIHNVIIDCLNKKNDNELEIIGLWYYRFLVSNQEFFSLHIPSYSVEFTKLAYSYVRLFTVGFDLLKQDELTDFKDTCLFDIFNDSDNIIMEKLTLDFNKQKDNIALWGKDTLTKLDEFLPVFNKNELIVFNKSKTLRNTFKLFKSIRNSNSIISPMLIELEEKVLTFNNVDNRLDDELISEKVFSVDNNLDDDDAMEIEEELIEKGLKNRVMVKYPYSKKPHPYLMDVCEKRFKLVFNNRFAYNNILEEDIYLTQADTNLSTQLTYNIVETNHSKDLYNLFKDFKEQWNNLELNKFTTPFPKYWFLFLNESLSNINWLTQFKKDFPAVAERPIIKEVESIINEIIKINWIKNEITDSTKILFPELKSNRKKRLEFVFNNFKNYIHTINQNVEFITTLEDNNFENVIVLDSFNIIDLVNKNQCNYKGAINIIVPDFLYFGYQPWIKYHLFNYQFTPIISGLRESLDTNFISNKEKFTDLKNEIIKVINTEFQLYQSNFKVEAQEEEPLHEQDENPSEEDIEFTNEEEIENTDSIKERNEKITLININQNLENKLTISPSEKVLLQKDTLLYVKAENLKKGDFIIRNNDILNLFKTDDLYDNLVNIPIGVLHYQIELSKNNSIYQTLKSKGISYQHQNYFDATYVKNESSEILFRIPRRKKDWAIICEFLNIDDSGQQLAFIAYYGRSKQNELKKMYKSIIDLLLENNWIGTIENPEIITSVSNLVNEYKTIFNTTDEIEIREISDSIISTILDQLKFTEIKTIEIIKNE